jgi:hypothetical protein
VVFLKWIFTDTSFNTVHGVLSGGKSAEQSLADLEASLKRMSRGGRW